MNTMMHVSLTSNTLPIPRYVLAFWPIHSVDFSAQDRVVGNSAHRILPVQVVEANVGQALEQRNVVLLDKFLNVRAVLHRRHPESRHALVDRIGSVRANSPTAAHWPHGGASDI